MIRITQNLYCHWFFLYPSTNLVDDTLKLTLWRIRFFFIYFVTHGSVTVQADLWPLVFVFRNLFSFWIQSCNYTSFDRSAQDRYKVTFCDGTLHQFIWGFCSALQSHRCYEFTILNAVSCHSARYWDCWCALIHSWGVFPWRLRKPVAWNRWFGTSFYPERQ